MRHAEGRNALCACGEVLEYFYLDDPVYPTMRIYPCPKCGKEELTDAFAGDGRDSDDDFDDPYLYQRELFSE